MSPQPSTLITPEMLSEAIATAHRECNDPKPGACIHADALAKSMGEIIMDIRETMEEGFMGPVSLYAHALHVGYRLHQLATEPVAQGKAN